MTILNPHFSENPIPRARFTHLVIPVEILEHPELSLLEQHLISYIDALYSDEHGGCFASNEYLAKRLKVKENTIAKALTHLRQLGLIEDVSFNGRYRVIRACIGKYVEKCQSKSGLDYNPMQGWIKIQGRVGEKSNPSILDNKEESKEDINTPPSPQTGDAASAADDDFSSSSSPPPKKDDPPDDPKISDEAKKLEKEIISHMQSENPNWNAPKTHRFSLCCDKILQSGYTHHQVIKVVLWALKCEFRSGMLFKKKTNPGTVLLDNIADWFVRSKNVKDAGLKEAREKDKERALKKYAEWEATAII